MLLLVRLDEERAIQAIPKLLPKDADKRRASLAAVHRVVEARGALDDDVLDARALEGGGVRRAVRGLRSRGRRHQRGGGRERGERAGDGGDHALVIGRAARIGHSRRVAVERMSARRR